MVRIHPILAVVTQFEPKTELLSFCYGVQKRLFKTTLFRQYSTVKGVVKWILGKTVQAKDDNAFKYSTEHINKLIWPRN